MIEFLFDYTSDELKLQGTHYKSDNEDICVVCIHGMGGNIIENYFATVWGDKLSSNGIGFIYGHNRGYSHINDITAKDGSFKRIGTTYEIFEESEHDVDLWAKKAKELGYKKIILLGHSFGCNKCIYYLSKNNKLVDGLILASPPDMQGLTREEELNYDELLEEAKRNVESGNPKKWLSQMLGEWNYMSSEAFYNWYKEGSMCDNLPIKRNPEHFEQLQTINIPILAFSGSEENELYHKFDLVKSKALKCQDFKYEIIKGSGHTYKQKEEETANIIIEWINKTCN